MTLANPMARTGAVAVLTAGILTSLVAQGDAIVLSQAMFADSIAEYFVEDGRVRVELEIGVTDLRAFRNLLPDAIYEKLEFEALPLSERLPLFTQRDLAVLVGGSPLPGTVVDIGPSTRPLRDSVTGEPLAATQEDPEVVIRATLIYPFEGEPESLTLLAPRGASMGFVLYHQSVAVNDFRFLSSGMTVNLDWEDSWYSAFSQRSMRRQYFAPMAGFIYVEPYEVRKEIIVRPKDLQRYTDLGLENEVIIPADRHDEIKSKVVEFLASHFPVSIDGKPVQGSVDRVNFLQRTLRSSVVMDDQDLDLASATIGVIYVFPTDGLPHEVEMEWDFFTEKMPLVPASTVDQAGPLPVMLEEGFTTLRWENFLRFPELPTLTELAPPPGPLQLASQWLQWLGLAATLIMVTLLIRAYLRDRAVNPILGVGSLVLLMITGLSLYGSRQASLDQAQLEQLVGDLLHNVYRAFDHRGESETYGVLEKSVSGDLLTDIYLETRRGLTLANQGGARVKVKETEVLEAELKSRAGNELTIDSQWRVSGSVGHWGHVHQRTNKYHANLTISEIDGAWKLTRLQILDEQRL